MIDGWKLGHEETLDFSAFENAAPLPPAPGAIPVTPSARIIGVGADLRPTEDARALQDRLARSVGGLAAQAGTDGTSDPR